MLVTESRSSEYMERKDIKDEEVRVEVKGEVEEKSRTTTHGWHVDEGERLKDDLSQCGVTRD